jgi:predicted nucleic acid-binding protein
MSAGETRVDGVDIVRRRQMVNDILIAVTAARAGAVVITANAQDFSRIEVHAQVRWMLPV